MSLDLPKPFNLLIRNGIAFRDKNWQDAHQSTISVSQWAVCPRKALFEMLAPEPIPRARQLDAREFGLAIHDLFANLIKNALAQQSTVDSLNGMFKNYDVFPDGVTFTSPAWAHGTNDLCCVVYTDATKTMVREIYQLELKTKSYKSARFFTAKAFENLEGDCLAHVRQLLIYEALMKRKWKLAVEPEFLYQHSNIHSCVVYVWRDAPSNVAPWVVHEVSNAQRATLNRHIAQEWWWFEGKFDALVPRAGSLHQMDTFVVNEIASGLPKCQGTHCIMNTASYWCRFKECQYHGSRNGRLEPLE